MNIEKTIAILLFMISAALLINGLSAIDPQVYLGLGVILLGFLWKTEPVIKIAICIIGISLLASQSIQGEWQFETNKIISTLVGILLGLIALTLWKKPI
ncbi:MAG: hypothetical protein P8P30_03900 [Rickettsiales bacterium]|nr:hypothetical protein [Rickettsiales bacterium]